ncbi:SAM-dependent DNA methyltransferase [Rhizobium leguminosarum]|uniref:site-specific DNA-methyltransferase (adenine-specific) n=1 Tax=Rhizobium leguminosarum TaxID=384 RepID=A0AAJ1AH81_RHILE|nr:SAM-dependent methyltransferase [Rhizobium leguminosarum]MBY5538429.1 SAM-dependent DNA methyltransferase [Rhizobium leguminosarum]MBY5599550.1 SAM-dependent DNA methyltransferase [Rhizobium leguminosarum]MBY5633151.1 SAM-dependent DNA methyltransferase [Rhizobium leguminosarum]
MSNRHLSVTLRGDLRKAVEKGRIVAEEGARDAIRRLGVADGKAPSYLNDPEKELRRRLRAHARALGDAFDRNEETQETKRLVEAAAYAHWHRMLFARFLAERGLLRNPEHDVAITLEDCRELAEAEGLTDAWAVAERYAAAMLPAVFRIDDPVLALDLDPVHTQKLHRLVTGLDAEVFQAEDSLGWTYQFWRAAEKDAVNKSGVKIGADELPAVTQLFTEPYMVRFLLHNTLGAWWAGKVLAADPALAETAANEDALRAACSLPEYRFEMLRFVREAENGPWRPAAGTFPGWPTEAKAITMLDPCCGSGHFLTEALTILVALRQVEEGLSPTNAVAAVLLDNLHGLEIDGRCVQIAAFAVALTAWRIGGWQPLPLPHIAWVGAPPPLPKREFVALAEGDVELEYALSALHDLFAQAPILGSLIEPSGGDLFEAEKMREIERLLEPLLARARRVEPDQAEGVIAARGMADAAAILSRKHIAVCTNVPFLGQRNQSRDLFEFINSRYPDSKSDLATVFFERLLRMVEWGGTVAMVSPQSWQFGWSYRDLRHKTLKDKTLRVIAALGPRAFETISGEVVNVSLSVIDTKKPTEDQFFFGFDANDEQTPALKAEKLSRGEGSIINQRAQTGNPDFRINAKNGERRQGRLISDFAITFQGIKSGDDFRWVRNFWEIQELDADWKTMQTTVSRDVLYGGCNLIVYWGKDGQHLTRRRDEGQAAAKKYLAVAISQMGSLSCSILHGAAFDSNISPIFFLNETLSAPLFSFFRSDEYKAKVRALEPGRKINNTTFLKVAFDSERWTKHAEHEFPKGLPGPYTQDPTQWLFHGHPVDAARGFSLHVALSRLGGYRWPSEIDTEIPLSEEAREWIGKTAALPAGDNDGLLGVPAVAGEKALADRLRAYLAATFGADWSDALERRLVAEADEVLDKKPARDGSLEAWTRDRAFRQHCAMFGQRPFLWHISDGLKDGFSVFVHYHRFNRAALRKLTYTMLGDWLARAKAENNMLRYEKGRELQQMLEKVLEGEKPYDIFVRWKSLAQQPLGWDPDLGDGVRQNIRPFVLANVLTHDLSNILKDKDRGNDVSPAPWYSVFKGERRNDHHTTLAEKRAAREAAAERVEVAK